MIQKINKISDFPILAKVLDEGKVIVAKGRQNYSVYTKNIHGKKILRMSEVEALEGERLNTIIFNMDDDTNKYFVVYNGEDGEKGKTGPDGPEGEKGQSFSQSEVLNWADGVLVIANDDVTDDPHKVWSAYRGKVMENFIKSVSSIVMEDEEYQLRFNEQVFIDLEFVTNTDNKATAVIHNDNVKHRTYVKYWTYEDEGGDTYFMEDPEHPGEYIQVPNGFDIWSDYWTKEDKDENEKYYTRHLDTIVVNEDTGESVSTWVYDLVTAPIWMDLEFTTNQEDQTSVILSNDTELGSDGDNISKDDKEEEIIIIHKPITRIYVDGDTVIVPINNIVIKPIYIEPSDYLNSPILIEYDETKITVFEDGRIMALDGNCETQVKISSVENPEISCTINVNVITYVESITFDKTSINAFKGNTYDINTTIYPESASNKTLEWESSDEDIATVDENGRITLVSEGNVTIWARTTDGSGIYNKIDVTVATSVVGIILEDTYDVLVGIPTTIHAEVTPEEASNKRLIWESDNEDITCETAANGTDGLIYINNKSDGTIRVYAEDGSGIEKTISIIAKTPVQGISLNRQELSLDLGQSFQLEATVNPDADNQELRWTSSNPSIISVDETGFVQTISGGTVTITCEATDGSGQSTTCEVTSITLVTAINIDQNIKIFTGNTYQINYNITPVSSNSLLTWYTSDTNIATVENNIITGISEGICKVYCMANDNGGVIASSNVTVSVATRELLLSTDSLETETLELGVDESYALIATVVPDNTTNQNIRFTSLDPTIAEVDNNGFITGVKAGTTSILVQTTDGTNLGRECIVNII